MVFLALINVRCFRIAVAPCVLSIHPLANFRWRYSFLESLYNVFSALLPICSRQLATRCHIFAIHCPLTVWFLLLAGWFFSLVTHPLPLIARWLNAYNMQLVIPPRCSRFIVRSFGCSPLVGGQSPCPRRLFLAVRMLGSHFIKLADSCD